MITSGTDALKVVGATGGAWNWVLLGPSPETLPLAGGGGGGVDEMRECIAKTQEDTGSSNLYGVVRMEFGSKAIKRKFVFLRASGLDDNYEEKEGKGKNPKARTTIIGHAKAAAQFGQMEKAVNAFLHTVCSVEVHSTSELTVELILEKLSKVCQDDDGMTLSAYQEAMGEFSKNPARMQSKIEVKTQVVEDVLALECAPQPEVCEAQEEGKEAQEAAAAKRAEEEEEPEEVHPLEEPKQSAMVDTALLKNPACPYEEGVLLICFSASSKQWLDDGIVVKRITEDGTHDNMKLTKGSIKVCYNNRKTYKWLLPEQIEKMVRLSGRPRAPQSLFGELFKETHNWMTSWHVRYFDLSKGYLQWWNSKVDAQSGRQATGYLFLGGMECKVEGTLLRIRTRSSKGRLYTFDATTAQNVTTWEQSLHQHQTYCADLHKYFANKAEESGGNAEGQSEKYTEAIVQRRSILQQTALP